MASLTARSIGEKLGATLESHFGQFCQYGWVYKQRLLLRRRWSWWSIFARALEDESLPSVSAAYILFASKESQLFQLLFQNPSKIRLSLQDFLPMKDHSYQLFWFDCRRLSMTLEEASRLYQHLFILPHGMASYGCFCIYQFSMEEGLIIDRSLSISHQRNGRKEMIQLRKCSQKPAKPRFWVGLVCDSGPGWWVILGPSGSGEINSKCVIRLRKGWRGHILIQGQDLSQSSRMLNWRTFAREKICLFPAVLSIAESNG